MIFPVYTSSRTMRISGSSLMRHSLPFTCFANRRQDVAGVPVHHPAVGCIKEYIDEHYAEPVRLETLGRIAGLSPFHLQRIFRESEGQSPNEYLQDVRIRKAAELLDCDTPIVEAALMTGFYDQSHFTNVFRKATGTTPRKYRRKRKILQERP